MPAPGFTCQVCLDDKQHEKAQVIDGSPVCEDCVKELFSSAINNEKDFPARWGREILRIRDFAQLLGKAFVERYRRREIEYGSTDRVYCTNKIRASATGPPGSTVPQGKQLALTPEQIEYGKRTNVEVVECGAFVSSRRPHRHGTNLTCAGCGGYICGVCEAPFGPAKNKHDACAPVVHLTTDDILAGQQRGRDYQQCPACAPVNVVSLKDGCNHLVCDRCGTNFCFICGEAAGHDSDHWSTGKPCPRWNQPGAENAMHDDDPTAVDRLGDFVNEVIERGNLHVAAGNRVDGAWLRATIQELTGEDVDVVLPEAMLQRLGQDEDPVLAAFQRAQQLVADMGPLVPINMEMAAWTNREGLTLDDQLVMLVGRLAVALFETNAAFADLNARGMLPEQDRAAALRFAHNGIREDLAHVPRQLLDEHLPTLRDLAETYFAGVPAWL